MSKKSIIHDEKVRLLKTIAEDLNIVVIDRPLSEYINRAIRKKD